MKRASNLIEQIVSYPNLRAAWLKSSRGKRFRRAPLRFAERLDENLDAIGRELAAGRYCWGSYEKFTIYDPKEREIAVPTFRDRVAQHALINVCEPIFDRVQIYHSYACRQGKGQSHAVEFAARCSRNSRYYLKMDVRKYFASIDRTVLKRALARRFKDANVLRAFFDAIDSYENTQDGQERNKGIPIGSLTSQFFANHYLAPLDRFVLDRLKIGKYLRYMDDFILWDDDPRRLREARDQIVTFVEGELLLTVKPPELNRSAFGATFLGMKITSGRVKLANRSRLRFRRKYEEIEREFRVGLLSEREAAARMQALCAFVARAESRTFRQRVTFQG